MISQPFLYCRETNGVVEVVPGSVVPDCAQICHASGVEGVCTAGSYHEHYAWRYAPVGLRADYRLSSEPLKKSLVRGLVLSGMKITELGRD
jgi:hypothetical protein